MSKIPSQQVEWTRMGLEQQSDALGKWHYPADGTSDNDDRPVTYVNRRTPTSLPRLREIIDAISSRGRGQPG
ncbi:hypothetical protein RB195_018582 [Necator americanus]|uniref:Uncharacterized protein n=1 Tax=Necator americanus TaxID=51031 RepID=A0ABR1CAE7_NECAM